MSLYFISGVPGSGKTTLVEELKKRGKDAHDTDDECITVSKRTGKEISYETSKTEPFDWVYPTKSLKSLKQRSVHKNVFLIGSVDNWDEIFSACDEYIWLDIPLADLLVRLDTRNKQYGKSKSERQSIVDLHTEMKSAIGPKLFKLDATKPIEEIADDLLKHI